MKLSSALRGESATPILEISDLSVARSGETVIQEVNLDVRKGEFVGLVGPNGSGKTTLLLTILGLLEPVPNTGSRIRLFGNEGFSKSDYGRIGWAFFCARLYSNKSYDHCMKEFWIEIVVLGLF